MIFSNLIRFPRIFISGIYVPLSDMQGWALTLGYCPPLTYLVDLFNAAAMIGTSAFSPYVDSGELYRCLRRVYSCSTGHPDTEYDEGDVRKRIKTGNAQERSFLPVPRIHKKREKHEHKRPEPSRMMVQVCSFSQIAWFWSSLFDNRSIDMVRMGLPSMHSGSCVLAAEGTPEYKPVEGTIMTRWARHINLENVLPEYPRPQMVRSDWCNLNGLWDYAIVDKTLPMPGQFQGKILVPFAVESALSGVGKKVGEKNRLWYRRTFFVPEAWNNKTILLHFGAVDWDCDVRVNGRVLGNHQGGYDPF